MDDLFSDTPSTGFKHFRYTDEAVSKYAEEALLLEKPAYYLANSTNLSLHSIKRVLFECFRYIKGIRDVPIKVRREIASQAAEDAVRRAKPSQSYIGLEKYGIDCAIGHMLSMGELRNGRKRD